MQDYTPHEKTSHTNNNPSVPRTTGINWVDNRPQSLAQANLSDAIQRQIQVGGDIYSIERYSAREFRKNLMLNLQEFKYRDTGTKKMWEWVDDCLSEPKTIQFENWEALTNVLWDNGLLTRPIKGSGMGPKSMAGRPAFTPAVKSAIPIQPGEHRRHIISSSTLGTAIEKGYENLKAEGGDTLGALNAWIMSEGQQPQRTEYTALRTIWIITHNNLGNLWPGNGEWNSSIGFIRQPFLNLLSDSVLQGPGTVPIQALTDVILGINPPMKMLAQSWSEIINVLVESIKMSDPILTSSTLLEAFRKSAVEIAEIDQDHLNTDPNLIYAHFTSLLSGAEFVPMNILLDGLDNLFNPLLGYKTEYIHIYRKWIIECALSSQDIEKDKAKSLIQEWLLNCDLDYPGNQKTDEYYDRLIAIYNFLLNADKSIFAVGGALTQYMQLDWKG